MDAYGLEWFDEAKLSLTQCVPEVQNFFYNTQYIELFLLNVFTVLHVLFSLSLYVFVELCMNLSMQHFS